MFAVSNFEAPNGIAIWLACLFFVVALINQVGKLTRWVKGPAAHPPSGELDLRVKVVEGEVKRVDHAVREVGGEVRRLREDIVRNGDVRKEAIEGKLNDVRLELKEDIEGVRTSMQTQHNDVIQAVSELKGRLE